MATKYLQEGDWFSGKTEGGLLVISHNAYSSQKLSIYIFFLFLAGIFS